MLEAFTIALSFAVVLAVAIYRSQVRIMGQLEDIAADLDAGLSALSTDLDTLHAELAAAVAAGQAPNADTVAKLRSLADKAKALAAANAPPAAPTTTPASPAPPPAATPAAPSEPAAEPPKAA